MDNPKPTKRRWFRFSLRTMFVLVTALCGLLGWIEWNRRSVQERELARRWLRERGGMASEIIGIYNVNPPPPKLRDHNSQLEPSWLRTMLGDLPTRAVDLPPTLTEAERLRMVKIFPEAQVQIFTLWADPAFPPESRLDQ